MPIGARRLSLNGGPLYHYSGVPSFAHYAVTSPNALVKVDSSIPLDVAALFGCGVVTGAGCVFNTAKVPTGTGRRRAGARRRRPECGYGRQALRRLPNHRHRHPSGEIPLARELGCTDTFVANDPELVETVRDLTLGGVNYAFEISGAKPAMATANAITRRGGGSCASASAPSRTFYQYSHAALVSEEKAFRGSFMGSCVPGRYIPATQSSIWKGSYRSSASRAA